MSIATLTEAALLARHAKAKVTVNNRSILIPSDSAILRLSTAARICAPIFVRSKQPGAQVGREVRLNGQPLTLVFADEQAKANVNLLYAQGGLSGAEREVRSIVEAAAAPVTVELRPIPGRGKSFGTADHAQLAILRHER